jgi:hypothetical protein
LPEKQRDKNSKAANVATKTPSILKLTVGKIIPRARHGPDSFLMPEQDMVSMIA